MAIAGYQNSATGKFYIEEFWFINNFQTSSECVLFFHSIGLSWGQKSSIANKQKTFGTVLANL